MLTPFAEEGTRPWDEIPGVALVGIVIGLALLYFAIKAMLGKKK